jgi:excinuclease ABC subunit A
VSGSADTETPEIPAPTRLLDSIPGLARPGQHDEIVVRGARTHNLRNIDVTIPRDQLVVITGPSGSGKSSLAFDTLYAEGQRRYVESLSAYARQFLDQLEKPDVDSVEGLSPALSIEQRSIGKSPRSTVGTATEISDYLRLLVARAGEPFCHQCGLPISRQSVGQMTERVMALPEAARVQILAPIVRGRQGTYKKELDDLRRKGYVRARIDGAMRELDEEITLARRKRHDIEVVVDRIVVREKSRARLAASLEAALRLSGGLIVVLADRTGKSPDAQEWLLSSTNACADCGISYPELAPRMFSFNSPAGACPACDGLGVQRSFDPDLVVPDPTRPLREAIEPWQAKRTRRYYAQLLADVADFLVIDLDTPWNRLSTAVQGAILDGTGQEIGFSVGLRPTRSGRPRKTRVRRVWSGVLDDLARQDNARLARYQTPKDCESCGGARLRVEARHVKIGGKAIHELAALSITELGVHLEGLELAGAGRRDVAARIVHEIRERLRFLRDVGLDYLSLDRPSASLSGGEAQRIRLASQVGSSMLGVLYILDEPSVGLHARDNDRLLASLARLRDMGNSVVVVEHDVATIRAADHVIDMGPGAGIHGGEVVATGAPETLGRNARSPTGAWLDGRRKIALPAQRRKWGSERITLRGCRGHNLRNIDLELPLGLFTVVTGVSGSGKSTLINDTLHRALATRLHGALEIPAEHSGLQGLELVDKVIDVDQSPIGRSPRSNPATYTGAFGGIRQLFARVPEARVRGYEAGRFSFNVKGGRCEACQGDGQLRVEMNFLPDLFITCESCRGRRYERETLQITYKGRNIADVLEMTVEEGLDFMQNVPSVRRALQALHDVGLDYLQLGQPATTLSGGEAQRVKLAKELARRATGRTLYLLDEPTTGLHLSDVEKLLELLMRLVDRGNTVVVIEHHLDVIKSADHVVDLGPEGGARGGQIVVAGTPEVVAAHPGSHTGRALAPLLNGS